MNTCVCTIDSACDADPADFYAKKFVTARREHVCEECGCKILPGQRYERICGKWEEEMHVHKTCMVCVEIRDCYFCSWLFGEMWNDIEQEAREDNLPTGNLAGLSKEALLKLAEFLAPIWAEMEDE